MAQKSFNQRHPEFKWVLLFAVFFAIPLTVFSVQRVPTTTQQNAATIGAQCMALGGSCTSNRICIPANDLNSTGIRDCSSGTVCCVPSITTAPGGLSASYTSCSKLSPYYTSFSAKITLAWSKVSNGYRL